VQRPTGIAALYEAQSQQAFPFYRPNNECCPVIPPHLTAEQQELSMSYARSPFKALCQTIAAIGLFTMAGGAVALAGECPGGKMQADVRPAVDFKGVGVTDTTLGSIDLEKEPAKLKGRELRFRKLVIEPGGVVPWHSHDDRPALIYVAQGEIIEYASNCSEPIVHKAGDIRAEQHGTAHWWKNLKDTTVVLFVGDVRHDRDDHHM